MAKDINKVLESLELTQDSSIDEILNVLTNYAVVSSNEIAKVRSSSVYVLPTVVKDRESEVKQKMFGIVTDEENGAVAIINKRSALLSAAVGKLSEKVKNIEAKDLGEIQNLSELDGIVTAGVYTFILIESGMGYSGGKQNCILFVNDRTYFVIQTILMLDGLSSKLVTRTKFTSSTSWATKENDILLSDDVIDNLSSYLTNKALSANQGRILSERLTEVEKGNTLDADKIMLALKGKLHETRSLNLKIGKSNSYETSNDNELPTTKAVKKIVDVALGDIEALLEAI